MLGAAKNACLLLDGPVVGPKETGLELEITTTLSGPSGFAKLSDKPKRKSVDKQSEVLSEIRSRLQDFVGSHHKQPAGVRGNMGDVIADPKVGHVARHLHLLECDIGERVLPSDG